MHAPDDLKRRTQELPTLRDRTFAAELVADRALNNELWRIELGDRTLALRVPPRADPHGIDRAAEAIALRAAAAAGAAPPLIDASSSGLVLLEWIDGRQCGDRDLSTAAGLRRAAQVVRSAHVPAPPGVPPLSVILNRMMDRVRRAGAEVPPVAQRHLDRLREAEERAAAGALVLTHHDPWANNFLDDGTRWWLVDWEFSGAGDGMADAAVLALAAGMTRESVHRGDADELLALLGHAGAAGRLAGAFSTVFLFEAIWALASDVGRRGDEEFDYRTHARDMFARL